jgi:hypothetical protein
MSCLPEKQMTAILHKWRYGFRLALWGAAWLSVAVCSSPALETNVVINEFMALNDSTLTNKLGKYEDWIELYNTNSFNVPLKGWYLTDDAGNLKKWKFPTNAITTIASNGFLLVWADDKSYSVTNNELHTNFKLSGDGEYLALVKPDGATVVSAYAPTFPQQYDDMSYGIGTNGEHRYFAVPTPGKINAFAGASNEVADTKFTPGSGFYSNAVAVTITCATAGAVIRYTTDCSEPTTNSLLYTSAIPVTNTTVLRAVAFKSGYAPSDIDTHSYIFPAQALNQPTKPSGFPTNWVGLDGVNYVADYAMDPVIVTNPAYAPLMTNALLALPSLSIVTVLSNLFDRTNGIYVNPTQDDWDRPATAEWLTTNNTTLFKVDCGLSIQGGAIRPLSATRKKSFRMLFKSKFGPSKLDCDLFDEPTAAKRLDNLILRAGAQDAFSANGAFVQNAFVTRTQQAMGWPSEHATYAHLYLNGLYWGLYNPIERGDESFAETYYGGDKTNWSVGGKGRAELPAVAALRALCNAGLADNAAYQKIQGNNPDRTRNPAYPVYLDILCHIDYHILEHWIGIGDWHSIVMCNSDKASSGFRYPVWDSDYSLTDVTVNRTGQEIVTGYYALLENAEYRLLFADRIYRHMFNGGALTPTQTLPRYRELAAMLDPAILGESARWGDLAYTIDNWRALINSAYTVFLPHRTAYEIPQYRQIGLYPSIDPPFFNQQGGAFANGFSLTLYSTNAVYYTLDGTDPREYGTGNPTGLFYTGAVSLPYTVKVKARARSSAGEWSALNEALFVKSGPAPQLRITEVMYHPRKPTGTETNGGWNEDDFQFIELLNTGEEPVGLDGMRLTDGGSFDFSDGAVSRLLPGEYAVVVKNKTAFTNRYAALMPIKIAGEFKRVFDFPQSELSHNGETVTLKDAANGVMATFTYGDGRDWPAAADGAGHSLVPLPTMIADQANGGLDYGGNWRASAYRDGSPGRADPNPVTDVVLNEIMAHTDFLTAWDSNDWIEFYNKTSQTVSFTTNWFLSDDPENLKQWMIPGTNSVAATNWITFFEQTGFHSPTNVGFGLSKGGDAVYLSYLAGGTNDRVVDCVRFKAQANFRTWGRYPDGASSWYTTVPTTNKANALTANTVVINEIMYHPATNANYPVDNGDIEYVELYNPGGGAITLTNEGGACRLSSGVSYVFPTNTTIPAGGYLTLVSFDPSTNSAARAAFLASYGLTNGQVRLMGPYSGRLSDGGDRVAVESPLLGDLPGEGISWVIMDEVYYSDRLPWPENADGAGTSLNRLQTGRSGNDPANWMGASPTPGTSNTVSAATPMPVVSVTSLSVPEGGTNTFKVWLSAAPAGNATVTVSQVSGDANITVQSVASLVFTSGNATQTVTLAAAPDANAADGVATFVCAIANGASVAVAVTEADRDVWVTVSGAGVLGTVSPSEPVAVTNGGAVVISAQANPGYAFTTWSVVSGTATIADTNGTTTSVRVFGPATLAANFTVDVFTCSIAVPTNRMVVLGTDLTIQATTFSSPRACTVASMEFYANGVKFGTVTSAPYMCQWTPTTLGMYALTARATDNLGRTRVSATETVAVVDQDGVTAIGGTATNYTLNGTNFTAHVFTNSGLLVASSGVGVEVLLVAGGGGGGGGWEGGGGGGGGVRLWSGAMGGAYTITVGAGGDGAVFGGNVGANGMPSSIVGPGVSISATGGGRGSAELSGLPGSKYIYAGAAGGSGGGDDGNSPGAAVGGGELGNRGGNNGSGAYYCGGGGGAGGPGGNSTPGTYALGGAGTNLTFSGASVTYATGGKGGNRTAAYTGTNGTANRGNGGEGAGGNGGTGNGGNGGSGIVIVRYVTVIATNIYTVAYDANGANSGSAPATQSKTQNVAMAVSGNSGNLAKAGHTFAGWNTATNGTGANYAPGANYPWNASVTLYAKWMTNTPPTITAQPIGTTVYAGLTATFGVTASGIAPLFYQWYTNNAAIGGAGGTTYITPATTTNDSGKTFTVTVSNSYGAVTSSVATLTVNAAPTGTVAGTGGVITRYRENGTIFIAHSFTNSSAFTLNSSMNVQYLVVAGGGGGGGGYNGGGGGAGGVRLGSMTLPAGSYIVTVGAGGPGANRLGSQISGSNGLPSSISTGGVTIASATGGGRGASESPTYGPAAGASGGGGGHGGDNYGADGTPGEGNAGGNTFSMVGGGGGGAGGVGQTGSQGGTGGVGIAVSYSGVQVAYATGGYGCAGRVGRDGTNGLANTGNGGGGGDGGTTWKGGNGGSGIVIVRYVDAGAFAASVTATAGTAQWPVQVGAFTIARPVDANTNYEAVVNYTMSGTAINGVDYSANSVTNGPTGYPTPTPTPLSGYATFGVGVTSVTVNLCPLYNPSTSAKTATMTLNVPGDAAANVNFPAADTALTAPTALTATAVNTHQIQLAWTDNATNETGYALDRSPDGSTWNALTLLAANATAYTDDGLAASTRYYYRLAATNSDGLSAYASANATTFTNPPPSAILTSVSSVSVPEGGANTFQANLSSQPTSSVVVAVAWASGDTSITVTGGASLTFTTNNWATNQTVTLAAAEDADAANGTATITCSSPGMNAVTVTATEADNDTTLTVTAGTGGSTTPSGATVVTKNTATGISATAGAGYAFANWSVTSGAATFANSNASSTTVTISSPTTVQANFIRVAILTSAPFVGVPEGGTAKFRVSLSAQPAGSVTVSVAHGGDSQLSVMSGGSLVFSSSNWNLWKTVTLADAEDGVTNRRVATFTCSAAGMDSVTVTATGIDNDGPVPVDSDGDGLPDALEARLGRATNAIETLTALPFAERFESDTVSSGLLHGQHNWMVNPTNGATVQTGEVFEGVRALQIQGTNDSSVAVSQAFTSTPQTVWLDLRLKVAGAAIPGSIPDAASVFFFNDAGQLVVCDGMQSAGTQWITLTNTASRQAGTWARLTASADYVLQTWSLYLDGTNVASNLGFAVPQKRLTCLSLEGPAAVVDNLTVGYGRPDGIPGSSNEAPDDWYLDHFGTLAYSDTDDPDHDDMNNLAEYLAGTDPNDPASLLEVTDAFTANPDKFVVRWQSATGRVYTVQVATNLLNVFGTLTNGIPATPMVNVYTDIVNGVGQKFYRIKVE